MTDQALRISFAGTTTTCLCVGVITTGLFGTTRLLADCPPSADPREFRADFDLAADASQAIVVESDSAHVRLNDDVYVLEGDVVVIQGKRKIRTRDATIDQRSGRFSVESPIEYSDPNMTVTGDSGRLEPDGSAVFEGARFELPATNARGSADRIRANALGEISLDRVRYTTCPLGQEDWLIRASGIDIDQRRGFGSARNARLDFKGIPILYTPFISFPVGNERKTGFLMPTPGSSARSGASISVPWYWNIAPNYDATFTPTWYAKRGARLGTQFRYLTSFGDGTLLADYLPDDRQFGEDRSYVRFFDETNFTDRLRLDTEAANVSDDQWFEDFGLGPEGTSITFLKRYTNLTYLGNEWRAILRAQNFQVIDDTIDPLQRPYTILPQLAVSASFPDRPFGLTYGLDLEIAHFTHNFDRAPYDLTTGWRIDAAPEVRMPLRGRGIYVEPAASFRYTGYKLSDEPGIDDTPSRSAPVISVDSGLIFERLWGSRQQRLQTLEPRIMYLYVPYRDQDELPNFDTGIADLNLVQLFRTNRYVGADRLADANQLSVGLTSRLLDAETGAEWLRATVGQAYYFETPRVTLPGEDIDETGSSDIIAELDLRAYGDWSIGMGVQWDPSDTRSEKGDVHVQYRPAFDRIANVGYRFRRGNLEQVDGSVAWPISERWSAYGRMVYSLEDSQALDHFAGLEYRSCCWRFRIVARRYVRDRTGDFDTSVLLQLELNGLSSVGDEADAFLERSIWGYSRSSAAAP
ncbi:MAG: LPS assembly protein LptD [Xanthomonadaceae bacterium]|nr:LPS assembly protein LptD [Xanthomonadaceae bacterium]